jgi:hypothetical protein
VEVKGSKPPKKKRAARPEGWETAKPRIYVDGKLAQPVAPYIEKTTPPITGHEVVDNRLWAIIARCRKSGNALSHEEMDVRVLGDGVRGGIRGLNKSFVQRGTPWHCVTIYSLCEQILNWGHDPVPLLKGKYKDAGYVPETVNLAEGA